MLTGNQKKTWREGPEKNDKKKRANIRRTLKIKYSVGYGLALKMEGVTERWDQLRLIESTCK